MKVAAKYSRVLVVAVALALCELTAYQIDATTGTRIKYQNLKGLVTDTHSRPIVGATVYFIDSSMVNTTPITPATILSGAARAYDEPLEDIVNNPALAKTLPKSVTNKKGQFAIRKLNANTKYFAFVVPAATDGDHLPGGDASRIAFSPKAIDRHGLTIHMSWQVPSTSTYIGSSACLVCHSPAGGATDETSNKHHGHFLMFQRPGQDSAIQDSAGHVGSNWNQLAQKFVPSTAYNKPITGTAMEVLHFQDFNASAANKFVIYESTTAAPVAPTQEYLQAYLWVTSNGNYNITLVNTINKADPNSPMTLSVPLLMGGYIRQRLLVTPPGLKGLYPILTFQGITGSSSQGQMSYYDRARKVFSEAGTGGGGLTNFFTSNATANKNLLKVPVSTLSAPVTSNENNCALCHLSPGSFTRFNDPVTGEALSHTNPDPSGYDISGQGITEAVGIGCEQCHGPGSAHRDQNLKNLQAPPSKPKTRVQPVETTGEFIVNPALLGNDRASMICGRCHHGHVDEAIPNGFPPVGISRAEFLAKYVSQSPPNGYALTSYWPDGVHIRGSHEGNSYTDFLTAKHYRNSRQLVACDDCHSAMGNSPYRYFLRGDPDDSSTGLCLHCHAKDVSQHVQEKTGNVMLGTGMKCINCHMVRTGKGGAGRPGLLLGTPTGLTSDANITYWEGDQSSHVFDVPHKFSIGVAGVSPPGSMFATPTSSATNGAMPIPYTNSCGTCHDASKLQYQAPQ